jgi:hypothetical protein
LKAPWRRSLHLKNLVLNRVWITLYGINLVTCHQKKGKQ